MASLNDLKRRISHKLEKGRAIQLSPDDLDLLVVSGAYAALLKAAEEELRELSAKRIAEREAERATNDPMHRFR